MGVVDQVELAHIFGCCHASAHKRGHPRETGMTKDQVDKALIEMERLREASRLADDVDEQRQYANDYHRLWRQVRPYVEGEKPFAESK
jgi:hypothetical protein